ncbi:MAG: carbohydrate binding domain-containing protein [Fibrobacter sp.]|nr:carbohydrate binding domain-containing protein [Fibrobacter sp.]
MRFFLSIVSFACLASVGLLSVACSDDKNTAGIEIGNPSIADKDTIPDTPIVVPPVEDVPVALPLTAEFTVDYSDVESVKVAKVLSKSAAKDEPLLLDSFALQLHSVRTYASYYIWFPDYNAVEGMQVWPYNPVADESVLDSLEDHSITVSFTKESFVDSAFKNIDLLDGGYLKEIGVSFKPYVADDIYGRVLIDGEYVPFEYNLSNFQSMQLRYHYSQIDTGDGKANLSVVFRAKIFAAGVDFSKAEISPDGVIYIDMKNNVELWKKLNERFVPSFQPLRYNFINEAGEDSTAYVKDIWKGIAADVGENTLINGNFASPFTTDWILVTQFGGKADTSVVVEKKSGESIMNVNVTAGGDSSFSVQLLQENVALIAGVRYKCIFTIWSDVEGEITARIGSYSTFKTIGFSEHVPVRKSGQSVEIEFTPEVSDPFARFELNLGKQKRKFWIKEVKVLRLTK